jgi:hypothetical protein
MCLFSRPVNHVSSTHLFARGIDGGRQLLVYEMRVEASEPLAMVLPIPVPKGCGDDAVRFVDLSGYRDFFEDLDDAFPEAEVDELVMGLELSRSLAPATLEVHQVGAFEASFVPTRADFSRLDPRFRLPDSAWSSLARYQDFGFCVFKLEPDAAPQSVQPMAFDFPRADPDELFFPTMHLHDGTVAERADFDHSLYTQLPSRELELILQWKRSAEPIGASVDSKRAAHLIAPTEHAHRKQLHGELRNDDYTVNMRKVRAATVRHERFMLYDPTDAQAHAADFAKRIDPAWGAGPFDLQLPLQGTVRIGPRTMVWHWKESRLYMSFAREPSGDIYRAISRALRADH